MRSAFASPVKYRFPSNVKGDTSWYFAPLLALLRLRRCPLFHLNRFRSTNHKFAGRSASLRMKYGYHSVP